MYAPLIKLTRAGVVTLAALVVIPGILVGCGQSASGGTVASQKDQVESIQGPVASTVAAELGENGSQMYVKLDKKSVPAGPVTFDVSNVGAKPHEMLIFKTDLTADMLPMGRNGDPTRVDEDKLGAVGEVAGLNPGDKKSGTFDLTAGKYVILCNKAGHFPAGQWTYFQVT
jgi:uncharacterized cupredoxin-like copper-binding protein